MAALRPVWASEMTSCTPVSPRAFRLRRNAVQKAPSSESPAVSADLLGSLGLDQRLEHQGQRLTDDVQITAGAQCIKQVGQGRLAEGHRADSLV
jgi:hypothetical protein